MIKRTLLASILPIALFSTGVMATPDLTTTAQPSGAMYFFEQATVPQEITTTTGSKLTIAKEIYKDGKQSLLWQYAPQATLTVNDPIFVGDDQVKPVNLVTWMYQDHAQPNQTVTVQILRKGEVKKEFSFKLDFSGWRGFAIPYRDIAGEAINANTEYDQIKFIAPNTAGKLYFDQLMVSAHVDNRHSVPDVLFPFVNPDSQVSANKHWNGLYTFNKMLRAAYPSFNYAPKFEAGDAKGIFDHIDIVNGVDVQASVSEADLAKVYQGFNDLNIKVEGNVISAPPLHYATSLDIVKEPLNTTADTKEALVKGNDLRNIGKLLLTTARYLRSENLTAKDRQQLTNDFMTTVNYVINQGFNYGSSYQILHHLGYQDREFFNALFIARDTLAANSMIEPVQKMMAWYSGMGRIFQDQVKDANADVLNTQLQWMLQSILLIPDQSQRAAVLDKFSSWLSQTLLVTSGVGGGFKPDYTVFHHHQHYPAYGIDALSGLAPTVYMISHTPYGISEAAHDKLNKVMEAFAFYTKGTNIPIAIAGRHPTEAYHINPVAFKWLALAGSADAKQAVDAKLAGIYARLQGLPEFEGVKASPEPVGVRSFNYSSLLVARGADAQDQATGKSWMLLARGFSRYLPGNESYGANNLYSRYSLYGKLEFIPADYNKRGFRHDGFNWNNYDGTTSIVLPFELLKAKLEQLPAAGFEEMLLSDQTYSGAVNLGDAGLFAQKIHGHAKYGQENFWANKSYFVVGNRVYALGSNIDSSDKQHQVDTTLFQQFTFDPKQPVVVNGQPLKPGFKIKLTDNTVIKNPNGVTYYVPAGQNLEIANSDQTTPDDRTSKPTTNNFTLAVLNHGIAPQQAGYQYAMVIEDQNYLFPAYRVLEKDTNVHAVVDVQTGIQGYAFFNAVSSTNPSMLVAKVSQPSMIIAKPMGNNQVTLAVVNPDLNFYSGVEADQVDKNGKQLEVSTYSRTWALNPSRATTTSYTLRGDYTLLDKLPNVTVSRDTQANTTTFTVMQKDAAVTELHLQVK